MTGTLINIVTVLIGSSIGQVSGPRLPERIREIVVAGLGLFTMAVGVSMFIESMGVEGENPLIPLVSLLVGGILGEWWRIEGRLRSLGASLEARFAGSSRETDTENRFIRGFLSASLLFCVGPMTILGAIQDGLVGDYQLLAIKSVLDGFAAMALASTLGVGVMFSVLVILVYQGGISLLAVQAQAFFSEVMLAEMTAVGGVLLLGLAIGVLLELRPIRAGNLLPALLVAPLLVALLNMLGLG
ncbi:MAG: DUF554 family protein [Anaerolineales bacterium]|nr:DUF554 family protein [Anaerolineales bacterium]